jgi:hypothetical protein
LPTPRQGGHSKLMAPRTASSAPSLSYTFSSIPPQSM